MENTKNTDEYMKMQEESQKENNMKEEVEEVTIEMLDKEFEDPKLSKSQEIEIEKMGEKVKELRVE